MAWTNDDGICLVCDDLGRHFVPPSMGKFGYYTCQNGAPAMARLSRSAANPVATVPAAPPAPAEEPLKG